MKRARIFVFIFLFFSSAASLYAEKIEAPKKTLNDIIDGSFEWRLYPYFQRYRGDKQVVTEGVLDLSIKDNIGEYFQYMISPRAIMDNDYLSAGSINDIVDNDIKRNIFTIHEWYARYKRDFFVASAGAQIYSWGTADIFNPTDYLNPRDFTDFIDNEKIAVPSAALTLFRGNWKADFIVIPVFTPSRLPLFDTRWSPVPENFPLTINDRQLPKRSGDDVQFATRIGATLAGWDFSMNYFDGIETVPAGLISTPIPNSVTPIYDKVRVWGGDFSKAIGVFEAHGEAAYFNRDNKDRDDLLQYILGFNYTANDIISTHDLKVTFEYAREETIRRGDNTGRYINLDLSHVFRNSLMAKFTYEFNDRMNFKIGTIYNINHEDYLIQPKFCFKPRDNWEVELGFDILSGDSDTLFGRYSKNDRGFIKTTLTF